MSKAILYDATKCTACRACQVACKQWWELPAVTTTNRGTYENPPNLSAETWNKIKFNEVGLPWHWGYKGLVTGDSANLLTPYVGDANTTMPEYKAFLVNIRRA